MEEYHVEISTLEYRKDEKILSQMVKISKDINKGSVRSR